MAKRISKDELLADINGKSSAKRQKAFKYISRNKTKGIADDVLNWLIKADEECDGSTQSQYWDLYEACMTLGALNHDKAIGYLEQKGRTPGAKDNLAAGMMYLKMSKKSSSDFSQILSFLESHYELLKTGRHSTMEMAAYATVANEKMVANIEGQKKYLEFVKRYMAEFDHDPTLGLIASSLAGFDNELKQDILEKIKSIGEKEGSYIKYFAEDALNGKYNKYNPRA